MKKGKSRPNTPRPTKTMPTEKVATLRNIMPILREMDAHFHKVVQEIEATIWHKEWKQQGLFGPEANMKTLYDVIPEAGKPNFSVHSLFTHILETVPEVKDYFQFRPGFTRNRVPYELTTPSAPTELTPQINNRCPKMTTSAIKELTDVEETELEGKESSSSDNKTTLPSSLTSPETLKLPLQTIPKAILRLEALKNVELKTRNRNMSIGQVFEHCAQSIEGSTIGYSLECHKSRPKKMIGRTALAIFSWLRCMIHDTSAPLDGINMTEEITQEEGIQLCIDALTNFDSFSGNLAEHFVYGNLSKPTYTQAHLMHIENHLRMMSIGDREDEQDGQNKGQSFLVVILKAMHWFFQYLCPHYSFWDLEVLSWVPLLRNSMALFGLVQLIVHRKILEKVNLRPAPVDEIPPSHRTELKCKSKSFRFRTDDAFGTDIEHPTAAMTGAAIGRNVSIVPHHLRQHRGGPDVQLVAQRLLAREGFVAAGDQLNIMAAAWIQAQVHGWVGHSDGNPTFLGKGGGICPMAKFNFFDTAERADGHYNSERSQWWDASFLYGQTKEQVKEGRAFSGGKLKVNNAHPDSLASRNDGTYSIGENRNSWVGVEIVKELFLKEHNHICGVLSNLHPSLTDDELFGFARNIIAALNAKIHTLDWTVELLKTNILEIGMNANWHGLTKAMFGKQAWGSPFKVIGKKKAQDNGVPFCLTEEFAAVYRLHPLCPPGVIIEHSDEESLDNTEFIPLSDLIATKGREIMRKDGMPQKMLKSLLWWPCGALVGSNYPNVMRKLHPTDINGVELVDDMRIDLAAIDLYRDRERGIPLYNEFRRQLLLKPFKCWEKMTGDKETARKLEAIYGPAPHGIERCDLVVGDLYEKKIKGFAISETSFIVFLLMASRRLDSDPYLNELYDEEHYTSFGLGHIEENNSLLDLIKRHYPQVAAPFEEKKQSAFKPLYGPDKWKDAIENKVVDENIVQEWAETKRANDSFFAGINCQQCTSTTLNGCHHTGHDNTTALNGHHHDGYGSIV